MSSNRVAELFDRVVDMTDEQRSTFLQQECGGDTDLMNAVSRLLRYHDRADEQDLDFELDIDDAQSILAQMSPDEPRKAVSKPDSRSEAAEIIGDRYELQRPLGHGAFGTVWLAQDRDLDRLVAIKFPHGEQFTAEARGKLQREAKAIAKIDHPNVVRVFDVCSQGDQLFIVSDYIKGRDLRDLLTEGPLPRNQATHIAQRLASALSAAHEKGVIHRDVKPANILIDENGDPHLVDFGLAKRRTGEKTLTVEGQIMGTALYMPPELARGESRSADASSDIYSLGVVLYEMLTGRTPFEGELGSLLEQIKFSPAPDPRTWNAEIPEPLAIICVHCLQKRRAWRYQSAAEMAADLKLIQQGKPISVKRPVFVERARRWCVSNPRVVSSAGVVFAGLVLALIFTASSAARAQVSEAKTIRKERAQSLALQARTAVSTPVSALLLAIEAVETTLKQNEPVSPFVEQTLWQAFLSAPGTSVDEREQTIEEMVVGTHGVATIGTAGLRAYTDGQLIQIDRNGGRGLTTTSDGSVAYTAQKQQITRWSIAESGWQREQVYSMPDGNEYWGQALAVSRDDRWLVCGSWTGSLSILDIQDGSFGKMRIVPDKSGPVWSFSTSNDGCVSMQDGACFWTSFSDPNQRLLLQVGDDLPAVCGANGKWLAASDRSVVRLWRRSADNTDWSPPSTIARFENRVNVLRSSPGGRYLAAAGQDGTIRVWDFSLKGDASHLPSVLVIDSRNPTAIAFDSQEKLLAVGDADGAIRVWELSQLAKEPDIFRSHNSPVSFLAFDAEGNTCSAASSGGIRHNIAGQDAIHPVDFTGTGTSLASGDLRWIITGLPKFFSMSNDGLAKLRTVDGDTELDTGALGISEFSQDSKWLCTQAKPAGPNEAALAIWSLDDQPHRQELGELLGEVLRFKWSSKTDRLVAVGKRELASWKLSGDKWQLDKKMNIELTSPKYNDALTDVAGINGGDAVLVHLADNSNAVSRFTGTDGAIVRAVALSGDSHWLATLDETKELSIWNTASGKSLRTETLLDTHGSLEFSPDGLWCAATGGSELVLLKNLDVGFSVFRHVFAERVRGIAFSPDSRWLTMIELHESNKLPGQTLSLHQMQSTIYLVDLQAQKPLPRALATGPILALFGVEFSPNSRWMACGDRDGRILRWDLRSIDPWKSNLELDQQGEMHEPWVRVKFLSNDFLQTNSQDGRVVVRDMRLTTLINQAKRRAGRKLTARERSQFGVR